MKKLLTLILITSLIFTSGCWDKQEIEERLYVVEMGLDLNKDIEPGEDEMESLTVTYQYPNINAIGAKASEDQKSYLITGDANSVFGAGREFMRTTPFPFYYKNLKVIIISEELLGQRELMMSILDEFYRSTSVNKRVRLLATDGRAQEILEANYIQEQRTEGTIYATVRDNNYVSSFTSKTLLDLLKELNMSGVSMIPKVTTDGGGFKVSGGCILKDYRFLDWVDSDENSAINMINGVTNLETIDVPHEEAMIVYTISESSSDKEIDCDDGIRVNLNISLEGNLQGHITGIGHLESNLDHLLEIERSIEDDVKNKIEKTINHLQEISGDILYIGDNLSKFHPKVWEGIKDDWDTIFPDIVFNVNVDAKIRRIGLTR